MGELITFYGSTDGSSTTGTVSLDSNILYSSVDYIRIPKGVKLKIWGIRAYAVENTNFNIEFTSDVTVGPRPTRRWTPCSLLRTTTRRSRRGGP